MLRIVVVGQEVCAKGKPRTTFAERYANVHEGSGMNKRFVSNGKHRSRNPHMKGTTLALRTILGTGSGIERAGEFVNVEGEQVHLFECSLAGKRTLVFAFSHPSSYGKKPTRWESPKLPYFKEIVYIRRLSKRSAPSHLLLRHPSNYQGQHRTREWQETSASSDGSPDLLVTT